MADLNLKVLTPNGVVYQGPINIFETTTAKGRIGICSNQPEFIATIKPNVTMIKVNEQKHEYVLTDGILHATANEIKVFTSQFELLSAVNLAELDKTIQTLTAAIASPAQKDHLPWFQQKLTNLQLKRELIQKKV